jgi:hypothetical protein
VECHTYRSIGLFGIGTVVDFTRYAMKRGIVAQCTGLSRFLVSETSIGETGNCPSRNSASVG